MVTGRAVEASCAAHLFWIEPFPKLKLTLRYNLALEPSYHFGDGLELRTLAHGSSFLCGWSGIAFSFDWYSLSTSSLLSSVAGSTGGPFDKSIFGWNWANADPLGIVEKIFRR
jgi:hypothetical protein